MTRDNLETTGDEPVSEAKSAQIRIFFGLLRFAAAQAGVTQCSSWERGGLRDSGPSGCEGD